MFKKWMVIGPMAIVCVGCSDDGPQVVAENGPTQGVAQAPTARGPQVEISVHPVPAVMTGTQAPVHPPTQTPPSPPASTSTAAAPQYQPGSAQFPDQNGMMANPAPAGSLQNDPTAPVATTAGTDPGVTQAAGPDVQAAATAPRPVANVNHRRRRWQHKERVVMVRIVPDTPSSNPTPPWSNRLKKVLRQSQDESQWRHREKRDSTEGGDTPPSEEDGSGTGTPPG